MSHPDGSELIVWREGTRRCELWSVGGAGVRSNVKHRETPGWLGHAPFRYR